MTRVGDTVTPRCMDCGEPVELTDSGAWWVHVSMAARDACGTRFADTADHGDREDDD